MKPRLFGYDGRHYVAYYYFIWWSYLSLGFHVHVTSPNIEIHLPFGFIRVGRRSDWRIRNYSPGWSFGKAWR